MKRTQHVPVMMEEVLTMADLRPGMTVVDATLGGGGYTRKIFQKIMPEGTLIAFDQDMDAIERFKKAYPEVAEKITIVHSNYSQVRKVLKDINIENVDVVIADLGLSSDQLEESDRGFSFSSDSALDMRMDQSLEKTAQDIVNEYSEESLANVLYEYGDERFSRRIARAICKDRPVSTTQQLAEIVGGAIPHVAKVKMKTHPATKTFQAIRIEVNQEYDHLKTFLTEGIEILSKAGKFIVVSFHSGEDRLVKNIFRTNARGCICPEDVPICQCGHEPQVQIVTKKPMYPSEEEIKKNPRARSARLRSVVKK